MGSKKEFKQKKGELKMIRFIINTYVSKRDTNGNCYNFSIVTSTKTGNTIEIDSGYGSDGGNVKGMLRNAEIEWEEMHYSETVMPVRKWNEYKKIIPSFHYEHNVTPEMFFDIEK